MAVISEKNTSDTEFQYSPNPLGKGRKIRILMVGAGLTGIGAVKIFKETFPSNKMELVIYEKNSDVTGTWLENRYPGCGCDVPAHAYTYSWEGNPRWSRAYVGALELFDYFKGRAIAYGVNDFVHLENRVDSAAWDDKSGKWNIHVTDLSTGSSFEDEGDILINAAGFLNSWKWPEIQGLHDFGGKLLHSASWDSDYDFKDKTVIVIGTGSSAIQLVPQLQSKVKHLVSINRSKIWITAEWAGEHAPEGRDTFFSGMQKENWATNKDEFLEYRRSVESTVNGLFDMSYKDSESQKWAYNNFAELMRKRLGYKQDLIEKLDIDYELLVPDFEVGCRRGAPGHGYLEALASDNVSVVTTAIQAVTKTGLLMADGSNLEADAIICATGFDTSFRPGFPVVAFDHDLREVWKEEPTAYMSIAAAKVPNYFIMSGPNFPLGNGGLIPCLETNVRYAFAAAKKIQYEGIKSLAPKPEAVHEFQQYKDSLMKDLVWTGACVSW
ncbi:hypothetical protein AA0113_g10335 [Alternaria arborescens]|uniref:Sterigmatocystin biosynthesis monooxygenase n=1 Tax=Alternaria arborescens TaxID=156630 RepID=A0A4Q4QQF0_9PLEO|nr:hypothetical protein AA0113_g10335 [Alternaria arborescens]